MLVTSILHIFLLTPAILAILILGSGTAESFASATAIGSEVVATASAVGGGVASSASGSASASVYPSSLIPNQYFALQTVPAAQNVQTVQHIPIALNYQTVQQVPVVQQQLPAYGYGGSSAGDYGSGVSGGFGRYRESYTFRSRGFGRGFGGFGHNGFGGGRFKAHYASSGVAAGGLAGIGGGFVGGGGAALLG